MHAFCSLWVVEFHSLSIRQQSPFTVVPRSRFLPSYQVLLRNSCSAIFIRAAITHASIIGITCPDTWCFLKMSNILTLDITTMVIGLSWRASICLTPVIGIQFILGTRHVASYLGLLNVVTPLFEIFTIQITELLERHTLQTPAESFWDFIHNRLSLCWRRTADKFWVKKIDRLGAHIQYLTWSYTGHRGF